MSPSSVVITSDTASAVCTRGGVIAETDVPLAAPSASLCLPLPTARLQHHYLSLHLMQNDSFPSLCLPLLTATVYVMTRHQQCPDPTQTLASFCIAVADSPSRSRAQRTGCVYEAKNFCPSHCTGKTAQFLILTTSYCLSLLRTQNLSVETTVTCDGPMSSTHGGCRRMQ